MQVHSQFVPVQLVMYPQSEETGDTTEPDMVSRIVGLLRSLVYSTKLSLKSELSVGAWTDMFKTVVPFAGIRTGVPSVIIHEQDF
jgi:hypothetical protein